MKLPCCWNCHHEFKLCEIYWPWKQCCPVCNKKQFLTKESRSNTFLFYPIPMIIVFVMNLMDVSLLISMPFLFCILLIMMGIVPYFYHFTDKEAPFV